MRDRILAKASPSASAVGAHKHRDRPLLSVSIGEQKEAAVYVRGQASAARKRRHPVRGRRAGPSTLTQDECKARLVAMNDDADVLGVILQRPVPQHIHGRSLASAIHPLKDIEGMNPASIGNIVYNDLALAPCTAAASVELIKATGLEPARPRGRDDRPLRDRRQARRVHADGRGRDGDRVPPHDALGRRAFAPRRRRARRGRQAEVPARRHGEAGRGRHRHRHQSGHRSRTARR